LIERPPGESAREFYISRALMPPVFFLNIPTNMSFSPLRCQDQILGLSTRMLGTLQNTEKRWSNFVSALDVQEPKSLHLQESSFPDPSLTPSKSRLSDSELYKILCGLPVCLYVGVLVLTRYWYCSCDSRNCFKHDRD